MPSKPFTITICHDRERGLQKLFASGLPPDLINNEVIHFLKNEHGYSFLFFEIHFSGCTGVYLGLYLDAANKRAHEYFVMPFCFDRKKIHKAFRQFYRHYFDIYRRILSLDSVKDHLPVISELVSGYDTRHTGHASFYVKKLGFTQDTVKNTNEVTFKWATS